MMNLGTQTPDPAKLEQARKVGAELGVSDDHVARIVAAYLKCNHPRAQMSTSRILGTTYRCPDCEADWNVP